MEWRKLFMQRVREIAATGIDGIYVDIPYWMTHFEGWENTWASFDVYTVAEFKKQTGLDAKSEIELGNYKDAGFIKWINFRMQTLTDFMDEINKNIKEINPDCKTIAEIYPGISEEVVRVGADVYNSFTGRAYVYFGGAVMDSTADVIFKGEGTNNFFGESVSYAGDVNNDGFYDVIIGASGYQFPNIGRAYVYQSFSPKIKLNLKIFIEGFYKIFSKIEDFKSEGSFEGWMKKIMVNESLMFLRKKNRLRLMVELNDIDVPDVPESDDTIDFEEFLNILQELPDGYRTVFNLYVIEGFKHREIAEILGISLNTSKSQLSLAKKRIADLLKKKVFRNNFNQF